MAKRNRQRGGREEIRADYLFISVCVCVCVCVSFFLSFFLTSLSLSLSLSLSVYLSIPCGRGFFSRLFLTSTIDNSTSILSSATFRFCPLFGLSL